MTPYVNTLYCFFYGYSYCLHCLPRETIRDNVPRRAAMERSVLLEKVTHRVILKKETRMLPMDPFSLVHLHSSSSDPGQLRETLLLAKSLILSESTLEERRGREGGGEGVEEAIVKLFSQSVVCLCNKYLAR